MSVTALRSATSSLDAEQMPRRAPRHTLVADWTDDTTADEHRSGIATRFLVLAVGALWPLTYLLWAHQAGVSILMQVVGTIVPAVASLALFRLFRAVRRLASTAPGSAAAD